MVQVLEVPATARESRMAFRAPGSSLAWSRLLWANNEKSSLSLSLAVSFSHSAFPTNKVFKKMRCLKLGQIP